MARSNDGARVLPWPTSAVCDDGELRNLAELIRSEWRDHPAMHRADKFAGGGYPPGDERRADALFLDNRIRIARSLGRSSLAIISAMSGRPARRERRL
jgi:hypothetical protein